MLPQSTLTAKTANGWHLNDSMREIVPVRNDPRGKPVTTKIQTGAKRSNLVPMATGTGIRVKIKENTWIYVNEPMNDF